MIFVSFRPVVVVGCLDSSIRSSSGIAAPGWVALRMPDM